MREGRMRRTLLTLCVSVMAFFPIETMSFSVSLRGNTFFPSMMAERKATCALGITMMAGARGRGGMSGGRGGGPPGRVGDKKSGRMGKMVMQELMTILRGGVSRNMEDDGMREALAVKSSIVDVEMSPDNKVAKVHISVIGEKEERDMVVGWLQLNSKTIRYELAQNMRHLRTVPSLRFVAADLTAAMDVMSILDRIAKEREQREATSDEDSNEDSEAGDDDQDEQDEEDNRSKPTNAPVRG